MITLEHHTEMAAAVTFLLRMLPHLTAGKGFEAAGRAVLATDQALFDAVTAKNERGEAIRMKLTLAVYNQVQRESAIERQRLHTEEQARLTLLASAINSLTTKEE